MPYHHVLLGLQDEPNVRCILSDLSEKELRKRFVRPYRRGKNILCGSEVVDVLRIKKVNIVRTTDTSDTELKRVQEDSKKYIDDLNRSSRSAFFVGLGRGHELEHISDAGEDVTSAFIVGPPGHGDWWTKTAPVLKWVVGIGAGLTLAALLKWCGINK